ncbi:MAG: porin family protein [Planctomycetes bacterium]|nr:porin family protein [Planctomycetota bacterium]
MSLVFLLPTCFALSLSVGETPATPAPERPLLLTDSDQDLLGRGDPRRSWYGRVNAGLVTTDDSRGPGNEDVEFDEGFLLSAALGKRVSSGTGPVAVDVDVEALWTQQDASTSGVLQAVDEITVLAGMLNVTLDLRVAEPVSVYVGAGAGAAWMDVGTSGGFHDDDGPFLAWQARGGVEWRFAPRMAARVGYRFLNIDNNNIDDGIGNSSFDLETKQHVLELGLTFEL